MDMLVKTPSDRTNTRQAFPGIARAEPRIFSTNGTLMDDDDDALEAELRRCIEEEEEVRSGEEAKVKDGA